MIKITGAQIVEAAMIVAKFDAGDKHNFEVIGRRIQELPEAGRDLWSESLLLTVIEYSGEVLSKHLAEFIGIIVDYQIAVAEHAS